MVARFQTETTSNKNPVPPQKQEIFFCIRPFGVKDVLPFLPGGLDVADSDEFTSSYTCPLCLTCRCRWSASTYAALPDRRTDRQRG